MIAQWNSCSRAIMQHRGTVRKQLCEGILKKAKVDGLEKEYFEDNPKLAVEWARYKYRNDENALSAVSVIQSEIRCHKEKILDLTNPQSEDVSDFHRVRQNIIIHLRKFGKKRH